MPTIEELTKEYKHLKLWTLPDSYFGELWPNYYSSGFGRSRDSDDLEESNFEVARKALESFEGVQVVRESHWAVGWVEWIAIPADSPEALQIADDLCERRDQYPVLDEADFSDRETERANDTWRGSFSDKERLDYIREYYDQFDFRSWADLRSCIRGEYFGGYASELIG